MKRFTTSLTGLILLAVVVTAAQADFILWNDEEMTVDSTHSEGNLYDTSRAEIVVGGDVAELYAHNLSTVDILGGTMGWPSHAYNESTVTMSSGTMASLFMYNYSSVRISGGTVTGYLRPYDESEIEVSNGAVKYIELEDNSKANISGGEVFILNAHDSNSLCVSGGSFTLVQVLGGTTLDMSGGTIDNGLHAYGSSIVNFYVKDFRLGGDLTLDVNRIMGTGIISGEWIDSTPRWDISINENSGAGIFVSLVGPGDANCDGVVDDDDAALLAANWQTATGATWRMGDFNGDYAVNDIDATLLAANWTGGTSGSVPEPGTTALLLCGLACLALVRRRR